MCNSETCGSGGGGVRPPLTSLERLETTEQSLGITIQSAAAHARHRAERLAIIDALAADPKNAFAKRVAKMADCCRTPQVGMTVAGSVGCVWFRCRDRLCPLCASARSRQVTDRVLAAVAKTDSLRFLTLTLASSDAPLREQLDRLNAMYREFRRTSAWKRHVWGGIATIEVTRNENTGQWHPHLHVLTNGTFWKQSEIADAWKRVTGDSCIVDIRMPPSRRGVARYVAKYASKPPRMQDWPQGAIREFAEAIHRRRMLIATGNLHGRDVDGDVETERDVVAGDRIPLHAIERRSQLGCSRAARLLTCLASQSAAYQSSLAIRSPGTRPNLAHGLTGALARSATDYAELLQLWHDDPASFVTGGDGNWYDRKPPPRAPHTGRPRDHTAKIDDWADKPHRHW